MRKFLVAAGVLAAVLLPSAPAQAHHRFGHGSVAIDAQVRVAICHNVVHNGHVIIVSVNALGAHAAHLGKTDVILGQGTRAELVARFGKAGSKCGTPATTTTTAPPTTTTTAPPVTTTTAPPVTTTTVPEPEVPEAPHVVCPDGNGFTFKQAPGPCPEIKKPEAPKPAAKPKPKPQPVSELPRTGGGALALAGLGSALAGAGLLLRRLAR